MEEGNFATLPLLPQLKTKRKQVGRACANCRKSKTACSETRPCSRCVSHNVPDQCVDAPRKRRTKISAESDLNLVRVPKPRRTKQNKSPTQVKNELMDVDMMQGNKDDKDILMESCEKIQHFEFQQHLQQLQQQQQEKLEKLEKLEKQENISNNKFEEDKDGDSAMLFDIPYISDSTHFLQENHHNNNNNNNNNNHASQSFGSTGSLSDFLENRNNPSLESLIVNVVGDIKKEKDKGFVVISAGV